MTDDEKEALRVLELGLREATKELMTPEIKKGLRQSLNAYKEKKILWNTQKEAFYGETGYDFEFEKVFDFLITNTPTGSMTLGEFLGLSDTEIEVLFDLWSVLYPEYRRQQREAMRRKFSIIAPPVATSTEAKQEKKEINITPENAELIYRALVPYFTGQETSLRQLLNGERIEKPLGWSKNANQLTHIFWSAKRIGYISDSNIQICEWILTNFRYNNGKKFERSSVTKDLNTQATRCKKPLPNSYF